MPPRARRTCAASSRTRACCVLSLRPGGLLGGLAPGLGRRRRDPAPRDFLEFNQELATLLKAGMPLVQSLDLLRGGLADPVFKPVLDTVYERVKAGRAALGRLRRVRRRSCRASTWRR